MAVPSGEIMKAIHLDTMDAPPLSAQAELPDLAQVLPHQRTHATQCGPRSSLRTATAASRLVMMASVEIP